MADTRYITHDKWSSLTAAQVTYPNGRQVASGYDALYRRTGVNETSGGASIAAWEFFGYRTATSVLGNGITCSYMNNAQTNSAVQVGVPLPAWGDKTTDRLGYDGSGRMITKRFLPPSSTTSLVGFTTEYDPSSNKRYERALNAESRSSVYPSYDSIDRLREYQRGVLATGGASVTTPITLPSTDSQRSYDLDSLGNWNNTVFTPEGTTTPTTEIRRHNRLNEVTQVANTPVLYDHGNNAANPNPLITQRGNGNITDDGTRLYGYDALNRLTTVNRKSDNAQIAAYTYDALGRRVRKAVSNGGVGGSIANATYRYIYDGQQIVEELLFTGGSYSTLRQFVWGQYIDELIQLKIPATTTTPPLTAGTYYPLQDLLYRTTATTKNDGSIAEAYDYDAYGNTLIFNAAGTGGNWWADDAVATLQPMCESLFTGRQYDPETQIYWYRARYYVPELGRFVSRDTFLRANLYWMRRPIVLVDPTGHYGVSIFANPPDRGDHHISIKVRMKGPFGDCTGTLSMNYSRVWSRLFRNIAGAPLKLNFIPDANSNCCPCGTLEWKHQIHESFLPSSAPFSLWNWPRGILDRILIQLWETQEHFLENPFEDWVDDMKGAPFLPNPFGDDPHLPTNRKGFPSTPGIGVLKEFETTLYCDGVSLGLTVNWSVSAWTAQSEKTVLRATVKF